MWKVTLFFALVCSVALLAEPADAISSFVDLTTFNLSTFAVDTFVSLTNSANNLYLSYYVGYYEFYFYPGYFEPGSFPLLGIYGTAVVPGYTSPFYSYYLDLYATTAQSHDFIHAEPQRLIGLFSQFAPVSSLGFFLSDTVDHDAYPSGYGEYINRAVFKNSNLYFYSYDYFRGINDVFIGFIDDQTGFQGLWAGWYRNGGVPQVTLDSKDVESAEYNGNFNGMYHFLTPAAYVGAGGDPHIVARAARSEMAGVMAGDIVNLVDHPEVSVNAAIREFDFLPESMRENNYFGTVAVQLANGDRVLVVAAENEEGAPAYSVTLNGAEVALGSRIDNGDVLVHVDRYEALDKAHGQSWFQEQFPFQTHAAIARVWVRDHIVVDVSLSSKETFVDWHRGDPQVYRTPGAFLNVNMRDLVQDAPTRGLLRAVDDVHQRKNMRERALEKGMQLEERDIDVDFDGLVSAIVDQHRVASLF